MFKFFKEKFFFKINPEEKELIRYRVMNHDHITYRILLISIMILQMLMFVLSFAREGSGTANTITNCYRALYIFLFAACTVCLILLEIFYSMEKPLPYYIFVALMMVSFMLWGCGISVVDSASHGEVDLLYFTIGIIATTLFITLEPWVSTLAVLITVGTCVVAFPILRENGTIASHSSSTMLSAGFWIAVFTVGGLGIVGSSFNFIRRTSAIRLEIEVSKLNNVLAQRAYIDDLTKVYNRRYLTEHIDEPLVYGENPSSVIMLDIDHFKKINDNYGHQVGDDCLSALGQEIAVTVAQFDSYCVRYGGEEFLIFFKSIDQASLMTAADDLRKRIENIIVTIPGGNSIGYTISIGLASASKRLSYNKMINQADQALYKAKETRNAAVHFKDIK